MTARYFLSYSSGYGHLKQRFIQLMDSLGLQADVFDGPDEHRVQHVIETRINNADGVVVLYGPHERPKKGAKNCSPAHYPHDEALFAIGAKKPLALIVHPGTRVKASVMDQQTPAQFDFWEPTSFQDNVHHVIKHLLTLKDKVECSRSHARFREAAAREDTIFRGYLHSGSVIFHQVCDEVRQIIRKPGGIIPTKYLFAHADSYRFYEELVGAPGYTIALGGEYLLSAKSGPIADRLAAAAGKNRKLTVVSLGIGVGRKEECLLKALCLKGVAVSLLAIDINPAFLHSSLSRFRQKAHGAPLAYQFLIGDFDKIGDLGPLISSDEPVLFLALGGTFGNQDECEFLAALRAASGSESYLLMDYQTKESLAGDDKGGYLSDANKQFIQSIIRVFCGEEVREDQIDAPFDREIPELGYRPHRRSLSSVPGSDTIVMAGQTVLGQRRLVGWSTRYDKDSLQKFLEETCDTVQPFHSNDITHTFMFLCKLRPPAAR
ncbi:MAG TPA: L-histidine N(alpha)-methyltransferase [Gemmataceae bacterium]|nr:L-histidine N(alpha)-methyltransferase [Gemmataceae bacterium]